MNILIRTDSSSIIGIGHIMRDLVLAKRDFGNDEVFFAVRPLPGHISHKIEEAGYDTYVLPDDRWESFLALVESIGPDMVIVDHYGIGYKEEKVLKSYFPHITLMVLDDTYERHYCDILLNHNIYADVKRYKGLVPPECELRCGPNYTLLREEFIEEQAKQPKKRAKEGTFNIFLAMGGADTANLNIPILQTLEVFSDITVDVVTTKANQNLNELRRFVSQKPWIRLHVDSNEVAKFMARSDLAIVTPSVTINEVWFMQLPFIAIKTAENQKEMLLFLKSEGYTVLDRYEPLAFFKALEKHFGPSSIGYKPFTSLAESELKAILRWRNHPNIRRWMFSQHEITLDEHLAFIKSLKSKKDRLYFLVKNGQTPIGVIDFTNIDKKKSQAHIGLYADPSQKGVGSLLMHAIFKYAIKKLHTRKLIAEVFEKNTKAINLYNRFGFTMYGERTIENQKRVLCMEKDL